MTADYSRRYETDLAAHLLGRVGVIYKEEYPEYKAKGYPMNAIIGKEGLEKSLEDWLKPTAGIRTVKVDQTTGNIVSDQITTAPQPGADCYLTLDIGLQAVLEQALEDTILDLRAGDPEEDKGTDAGGAAAVVMDVNSGEILGMASYPTYSLATFSQDWALLSQSSLSPYLNRAISGTYAPGSTFKMLSAIAALEEGIVTPTDKIKDEGVYRFYEPNYTPACWIWNSRKRTHGDLTVSDALKYSCNYYFYEVLPVLTVLYAVIEITSVFESTGEAMRAILPIYMGDQNNRAVLRLTKHSRRVNQIFGVLFGVVLLVAADWIPLAFDIEEPYLLAVCARGLRLFAIACPTLSEMALVNSFYLNTGKPKIAMLETLLAQLVCPLVLVVPMILLFGMDGIFIGFAASAYLALLILGVVLYSRFGKESFPYCLTNNGYPILDEEIALDDAGVMAFVGRVDGFLSAQGVAKKTALHVELACEEYLLLIRDQNKDEKVEAECCVRVEPGDVVLSIWDSGEVFDMTDEDALPGSMRGFVVASLMVRQTGKKHMIATSFNRNCFRFPIGP